MRWILLLFLFFTHCASAPEKAEPEVESKVTPSFDHSKIRSAIASHKSYLSNCYGKALVEKKSAQLAGTVFVKFKIGPDGRATQPVMVPEKSSLQNKTLNKCLFAGLTSWDFPVHPEGLDLDTHYLFQFSARPPAGMQKTLDKFENIRKH